MIRISYIKHSEIDKIKWDNCINNSKNGNIYAWSWYLDAVSENWDALISDDYQYLMPLTWRQKWGFNYLYRPLLSQQLGVFSPFEITNEITREFIRQIPKKFRLIEITLNRSNSLNDRNVRLSKHISCELDLYSDYNTLESAYSQNNRRNIKKTDKNNLIYDPEVMAEEFLSLMWEDSSAGSAILLQTHNQNILQELLRSMKRQKSGRIIGARNSEQELIAAVLFGHSHDKWYYLAPVNSDKGREKRALFGIIDLLIREQCGKAQTLDFEGSDIESLARFYKGFGAISYEYSFIRRNNLPWPITIFKG